MGTSASFTGSGGKDAKSLRDSISDWLGDSPSPEASPSDATTGTPGPIAVTPSFDPSKLAPMLRLWNRGGAGGGGGGGGAGGGESGDSGRSSGGPRRTVARLSGPAGRASSIASAYSAGNREAVEAAGLDYDELRALADPLEIGQRIAAVAFETQPDGTIEDAEARLIVAELVGWIMEAPPESAPQPDDIVRRTIELMIVNGTLSEVGATIRKEKDKAKRIGLEGEIRAGAEVLASKVTLNGTGASAAAISQAIERGVAQLIAIYGGDQ